MAVNASVNESLAQLSNNFVYSAMAVYTVAMIAFAAEWALGMRGAAGSVAAGGVAAGSVAGRQVAAVGAGRPPAEDAGDRASGDRAAGDAAMGRADRVGRIAVSLTVLAFGLHLAGIACRGLSARRVPWGNMYEFSTAAALAVTGVFLFLLIRRDVRWLGVWVVTPVLLTLGLAVTVLYADSGPLIPALQSYWLAIHVTAAVISTGGLTVGALATALFLVADRHARTHDGRTLGRLPSPPALDRVAHQLFTFTFPLWTFAIMAGAIWAENAWGRYWGWDPKETWSFITWVVFAAYLHARATAGWRERRAAVVALIGYACLLFNFIGVNMWITGLHSYA